MEFLNVVFEEELICDLENTLDATSSMLWAHGNKKGKRGGVANGPGTGLKL